MFQGHSSLPPSPSRPMSFMATVSMSCGHSNGSAATCDAYYDC